MSLNCILRTSGPVLFGVVVSSHERLFIFKSIKN